MTRGTGRRKQKAVTEINSSRSPSQDRTFRESWCWKSLQDALKGLRRTLWRNPVANPARPTCKAPSQGQKRADWVGPCAWLPPKQCAFWAPFSGRSNGRLWAAALGTCLSIPPTLAYFFLFALFFFSLFLFLFPFFFPYFFF